MNKPKQTIPKRLGKYQIIERLAHGSMGTVYEAFDPVAEQPVAIKLSRSYLLKDKLQRRHFNQMFVREAKTARLLNHPNIMRVFEYGNDQGKYFIVMELVKHARTIKDYISDETLLTTEQALDLIIQCATGLEYAHSKGVIHRDIKPANLLVTEDKKVKLADFSIAHVNKPDFEMTMSTGFVGSPRYMSPEQIQEDVITYQTDLYSLGVVMYELLTGKHPFDSESFSKLIYRVVNEDPVDPLDLNTDLSEDLVKFIMRALKKDPKRRFQSASEMIKCLKSVYQVKDSADVLSEKESEVRALKFFTDFDDEEIKIISGGCVRLEFNQGDQIIQQEQSDQGFYVLMKGELSTESINIGDSFGEVAFITGEPYSTSITATVDIKVIKLTYKLIENLSESCQLKIYKALTVALTRKLISTNLVTSVLSELS
ncbi:MAG: protein kinase [Gammaproteobacteria bacterium]